MKGDHRVPLKEWIADRIVKQITYLFFFHTTVAHILDGCKHKEWHSNFDGYKRLLKAQYIWQLQTHTVAQEA